MSFMTGGSVWLGDFHSGCRVNHVFTSTAASGAPTAITGTQGADEPAPCVLAYRLQPGDVTGFTCSSAGITFARDCSGRLGWNVVAVNTAIDLTFYSCGHDYALVINGGLIGAICTSGYTVGTFSILNRANLPARTPGRTAQITTSGEMTLDPTMGVMIR